MTTRGATNVTDKTPLRVVIVPSGFKENLSAEEVARAIAVGVRAACPEASVTELPLADGGELSDYDVILVVSDIHPFRAHRNWIGEFGEVLVAYWDPVEIDPDTGIEHSGNIVQYMDGQKIDFGLWPVTLLNAIIRLPELPAELDAGYRVLADKDHLTAGLGEPTYTGYIPAPPDEATYHSCVNDFYIGVPYVAKCLLRDELLPAKWCLDYDMRDVYLRPMLEWRMECDHGWSISPGALGKGLKRRLPPEIWSELEATYAGARIADNWESLFRLIALFRRVAREVAVQLEYSYPEELDSRVTAHARRMRKGDVRAGAFRSERGSKKCRLRRRMHRTAALNGLENNAFGGIGGAESTALFLP